MRTYIVGIEEDFLEMCELYGVGDRAAYTIEECSTILLEAIREDACKIAERGHDASGYVEECVRRNVPATGADEFGDDFIVEPVFNIAMEYIWAWIALYNREHSAYAEAWKGES
jgi:hypothetical protein